jgi:hypothetical protein
MQSHGYPATLLPLDLILLAQYLVSGELFENKETQSDYQPYILP